MDTRWNGIGAAALAAAVLAPAYAENNPDVETQALIRSLQEQVTELKDEVDVLRARDQDWLTEERADQIKELVTDVLADADTRASLLQGGPTAGYKGGFFITSGDGNFKLRIRGQLQARWAMSISSSLTSNPTYGFEVRRAKLKLDGHVVDPTWKYELNLAYDHDDKAFNGTAMVTTFTGQGEMDVEDAVIIKDFENGLELSVGQFKLPFLQEELMSSTAQLAVERSLVNEAYNQDRAKAVMLAWTGEAWRAFASVSDGFDSKNTPFNMVPLMQGSMKSSVAGTARVDWKGAGEWSRFKQFTSPRGNELAYKIGGAVHYEIDKYAVYVVSPPNGRSQLVSWTIDGMVQGDGWSAFAYVVGNHMKTSSGPWMSGYGAVAQGSYYFTDRIEGYARYSWGSSPMGGPDLNVLTAGANWYFSGQQLKWTSDIGVALTPVSSFFASSGADWLASATAGEVVIRSQFQLLF